MPEVAIYNPEVWEAYHSLSALTDMTIKTTKRFFGDEYTLLEVNDTQRSRIIFELDKAIDTFDYHNTDTESLKTSALRVQKALTKTYARKSRTSAQTIACMGHAHIDVAWLWPLRETIRKCARTFSNVLDLMERYPEFIFCQSQPHLYEFTRDNYPTIYKRIQKMAKKGQWIPTGCMWVEPDCNVTSGESLVRQVLFGTRFFEKEFNTKVASLWLPDVFGYSAALPQILKRSGINYFLTQKISWNQFTRFPITASTGRALTARASCPTSHRPTPITAHSPHLRY